MYTIANEELFHTYRKIKFSFPLGVSIFLIGLGGWGIYISLSEPTLDLLTITLMLFLFASGISILLKDIKYYIDYLSNFTMQIGIEKDSLLFITYDDKKHKLPYSSLLDSSVRVALIYNHLCIGSKYFRNIDEFLKSGGDYIKENKNFGVQNKQLTEVGITILRFGGLFVDRPVEPYSTFIIDLNAIGGLEKLKEFIKNWKNSWEEWIKENNIDRKSIDKKITLLAKKQIFKVRIFELLFGLISIVPIIWFLYDALIVVPSLISLFVGIFLVIGIVAAFLWLDQSTREKFNKLDINFNKRG